LRAFCFNLNIFFKNYCTKKALHFIGKLQIGFLQTLIYINK